MLLCTCCCSCCLLSLQPLACAQLPLPSLLLCLSCCPVTLAPLSLPLGSGDVEALKLQLSQQLAKRRFEVQQAVLDEACACLVAAVAQQQAAGGRLQLPAAVTTAEELMPSAEELGWDGRGSLPSPQLLVFTILVLACRVPMADARRVTGLPQLGNNWASLGRSGSMRQLVLHLRQFGAVSAEEAKLADAAEKWGQLSAKARVLLEAAVENGAPPEVLEVHDRACPPDSYLLQYTTGVGAELSAPSLACAELFLLGFTLEQAQQLVPGSPATLAAISRAACSLTFFLAAGDTSEAAAALRAEAEVDGTAGASHLTKLEQNAWQRNVMRFHELACRRLPALVDSKRISQEEACLLVRCLAHVAIPPGWTPDGRVFISTYLAAALYACFPSRFTLETAMAAVGRTPGSTNSLSGQRAAGLKPFVQQVTHDFAAAREAAAAQLAAEAEQQAGAGTSAAAAAAGAGGSAAESSADAAGTSASAAGGAMAPAEAAGTSAAAAAAAAAPAPAAPRPPAPSAEALEAILLAAAGRAACEKAGIAGSRTGLSDAAAAGSPTAQQLAARRWYLVDLVSALWRTLAQRVHSGLLSQAAALAQAERAARLLPPDGWQKPAGQFKIKPTGLACLLYALDPSIGGGKAHQAAGGKAGKDGKGKTSFISIHLAEPGRLDWLMPQLGTTINPTGVHV